MAKGESIYSPNSGVKSQWYDYSASFICPCGYEIIISDEPYTCPDCGRVYEPSFDVRMTEPPEPEIPDDIQTIVKNLDDMRGWEKGAGE